MTHLGDDHDDPLKKLGAFLRGLKSQVQGSELQSSGLALSDPLTSKRSSCHDEMEFFSYDVLRSTFCEVIHRETRSVIHSSALPYSHEFSVRICVKTWDARALTANVIDMS